MGSVGPAPIRAPGPADLGALHRLDRDDRMGCASPAQIRPSAGLQPDPVGGAVSELLPRGGPAVARLYSEIGPDRLGGAALPPPTPPPGARGRPPAARNP